MLWLILFIFGLAIGSFLNVVALRYDGTHFLFSNKKIGGRSHCPHCKKTLRWFELVPLFSFLIQGGRCRACKTWIGWRYPIMELLSGVIFVAIPLRFASVPSLAAGAAAILTPLVGRSIIWIVAFEIFLLIAYIDILLGIIPDELNIALAVVGLAAVWFTAAHFSGGAGGTAGAAATANIAGASNASFFGAYASIFGLQANIWIDHIVAALFGAAFFGALVAVTRGKGMGMGDVKLAFPLGLLFGWPDILIIAMMAFVIGGIYGLALIAGGKKTMKSAVPFGPFLVIASAVAFFWGSALFQWYFGLLRL